MEIMIRLVLLITILYGYAANIVRLTRCDFERPYKAELIRTVGVFVPPAGMILGYIPIDDCGGDKE